MSLSKARRRARVEASQESEGAAHLVFRAAGEDCVLPLLSVQRIVGLDGLSPRPQASPVLRGVVNLPGEPLVVVDLAVALGGRARPGSFETCALVVADTFEPGRAVVGLAVDGVSGVIGLAPSQLAPAPRLGTLIAPLVAAMAQVGQTFVPVLDLPRLLAASDVRAAIEAGR
jgi:purine-binding chemotaxis protein CheW